MGSNGHCFFDKVLTIIKEETSKDAPLIRFKHPKELENLLDLDVSVGVSDADLERCVRQILQHCVQTGKPTFRNQLYGATDPYGLAGAWIAEAFNTSQYTFEVAPAFTLIENQILRHMRELFGFPAHGDGIFSPGGSVSLMYAAVAARYKAFPEIKSKGMRALPELLLFASEDSHYSVKKIAHWMGFGTDSIRTIPCDHRGRMLVSELDRCIQSEKEDGRYPLMVNATAGTTVLGGIDDLEAVAEVCKRYGVWMHVDACWGGSLILSEEHRSKLKGIQSADSISWNPHKMCGAPLQCSALLCRHAGLLLRSNCSAAQYLFQQDKSYDVTYDTGDKSVQCGRKVDAFKLWLMWKARGDSGLGSLVDRTLHTTQYALHTARRRPGFRLVVEDIQCPNVCFWYIPSFMRGRDESTEWWDVMHKVIPKIKEVLTLNAELMVAYCPLRKHKNFFRLAITCHPEIKERDIDRMLDSIQNAGESLTEDMF